MRCGGMAVEAGVVEADLTAGHGEAATDEIEERGLAGAVRADQRVTFAGGDVEGDAANDLGRAEALADVAQMQRRSAHRCAAGCRSGHRIVPDGAEAARREAQPDEPDGGDRERDQPGAPACTPIGREAEQIERLALGGADGGE